ncbi:MAG: 3-deoxy-D-manno-octulosonic acid transferase [Pyrinomonadaceae bacterium]|nr:3-deoxy-D-manno-octulosonic acid transferase [Acidobacteriota bacterium]MBP7474852.1 3-deoxy-D-manno-octulosonic acid transferase [Pyrinomonadaceae bacterium]MBP9109753.1 3-deoxy-D-manno-octulosonic acid transferase [Pyrinomonadaceae bacterium]
MYFLYSIVLTLGFLVLLPRFAFDALFKGKYAAGFTQRLGFLPKFDARGRKVVWLHCVSVGEANAARPLAEAIKRDFPHLCLIVSTTTRTGQELARTAFAGTADLVFYFPFDWRWTVRRVLRRLTPSVVLLMETEIWFNFIREAYKSKAHIAIVNGRLSERSLTRYTKIKRFMKRIFGYVQLALMQDKADATRIMALGARASKVKVTGNLKFDHDIESVDSSLTSEFRRRFAISPDEPLIIAASTHSPEEKWILDAFKQVWKASGTNLPRLMLVPRHPERFAEVAELVKASGFAWARRSETPSSRDQAAEVILLDSIGELRAAYPLAEIVFVGGSLIPHGGQSIFEPAAAGRAIVTGANTANFDAAVKEFLEKEALIQLPASKGDAIVTDLVNAFTDLLIDSKRRQSLGSHALSVMETNRGAVSRTVEYLTPLFGGREKP